MLYTWASLKTDLLIYCSNMQASLKTEREKKKEMYYPMRKYAIKV